MFPSALVILTLFSSLVCIAGVDPESGGTVQRLLAQQTSLIQPGLSFINSSGLSSVTRSSVAEIHNNTASGAAVSATINIVNWSRWLLGYPVYYFRYGQFRPGEHLVFRLAKPLLGEDQELGIISISGKSSYVI